VEKARSAAAKKAFQEVKNHTIIGLGSGNTLALIFHYLQKELHEKRLDIKVVPASSQSCHLCIINQIPLTTLNENPQLDLVIDGADQVDVRTLDMIKGGGASLLREKILLKATNHRVIIVDEKKISKRGLNREVPVEVLPFAYRSVIEQIIQIDGSPTIRMGVKKNGPIVTDNGNYILDVTFSSLTNLNEIDRDLKKITGVVETGIFSGLADKVYIGMKTGKVQILNRETL
jgi:ribose 5-phosphate isomerase A